MTLITFTCFVYNSSEDYTGCVHWSRQGMGGWRGSGNFKCHFSSLLTTFWGSCNVRYVEEMLDGALFKTIMNFFLPSFICWVVTIALSTIITWLGFLKSGKGSSRIQFFIHWSYVPLNTGNIIPVILVIVSSERQYQAMSSRIGKFPWEHFKALPKFEPLSFIA